MTSTDISARTLTTRIVLAVGLCAGGDSYAHIYGLARQHGQDVISAAMLPLALDGVVIAASLVMLTAARPGPDGQLSGVPRRARLTFWLFVAMSTWANAIAARPHDHVATALNVGVVVSYLACTEMLVWMQQHQQRIPKLATRQPRPASEPDAKQELDASASDAPDRIRPSLDELLSKARQEYASTLDAGKLPTLRALQETYSIGQLKAQEIQRHLASSSV